MSWTEAVTMVCCFFDCYEYHLIGLSEREIRQMARDIAKSRGEDHIFTDEDLPADGPY